MQVTFDDQIFTAQRFGGVSRYFTELFAEFDRDPSHGVERVTPFRYVMTEHLAHADPARFRTPRGPLWRGRTMRLLNAASCATQWRKPALLHHTYYLPMYLRRPAERRVCTVYDMIPELAPELYPNGSPHFAKERYVRMCDAVCCISQTTKDDLLAIYGSLDKPVEVTPLAVSSEYYAARPAAGSVAPYLAYVGRREQYKNFDVVLRAFAAIASDHPDLRLLCAGGGALRAEEQSRVDELGLAGRIEQRNLGDNEMPSMYAGAIAMVFPSRYEGFGLPIVEAFAAGCPVVVADTPCSIEVSSGAAAVFDPDEAEALAEIVARIAADPVERALRIEQGRLRAGDFSWARTARLTAAVYERIRAA